MRFKSIADGRSNIGFQFLKIFDRLRCHFPLAEIFGLRICVLINDLGLTFRIQE